MIVDSLSIKDRWEACEGFAGWYYMGLKPLRVPLNVKIASADQIKVIHTWNPIFRESTFPQILDDGTECDCPVCIASGFNGEAGCISRAYVNYYKTTNYKESESIPLKQIKKAWILYNLSSKSNGRKRFIRTLGWKIRGRLVDWGLI